MLVSFNIIHSKGSSTTEKSVTGGDLCFSHYIAHTVYTQTYLCQCENNLFILHSEP